jgi:MYXO-CTERM domain-containing protein
VNFFNESTPRIITLSPSGEIQVEIAQIDAPGITPDTPIKSCAVIDPAFASCTQVDPCEEMDCTPEDQCQVGMCIDGECLFEPMLDGTDCNDNQNCTTPDVCQEGVCTSTEITCDDLNPCTTDFCVEATGECAFDATPMNEEPCDDNDPETTGDQCQAGTCVGELPPVEEKPEQDDPDVVEEPYIEYVEPYEIIEQDDVFEIDSYDITPEPDEEIIEPDPDALDAEEAIEEVENPEPNPEQDSDLTPEAAAELVEELTEEDLLEEETSIPGIDQTPEQAIDQDHPSPGGCQCSIGAESTNQPQDVEDTAAQVGLLALMAAGLASLRRKSQKLFTRNRKTPETA